MYQRIKAYVEEHQMLKKEDKVIVGVSGGADSVCLLCVLEELSREIGFQMVVVHVHHGLRGESADRDAAYVEELCRQKETPCFVFRENVAAYAQEQRMGTEEAGRELRRRRFEEICKQEAGTKIALAHHQGDHAETVLWNLCRGCGLNGLGGILPIDGSYIRPLLCVNRPEIESYLEKRGISYCTDETNMEDCYTRNRIRNQVIPYLEREVNEQTTAHICETARQMQELSAYVENQVKQSYETCVREDSDTDFFLKEAAYKEIPDVLKSYVLHDAICSIAGKKKDVEVVHAHMLGELMDKQCGREICLPYGLKASREYEGIHLYKEIDEHNRMQTKDETESIEDTVHMEMQIFDRTSDMSTFPEKPYTKWFDYDIIKNTVKLRKRQPGDIINVKKDGGTQKLKQYFINEKIPREERERIWLVADGNQIMWIVGHRQSHKYQITDKTRRILEITICGG